MIELARLEVAARWAGAPSPRHVGRALNAWLYGALARLDERLVEELHDTPGTRPFSLALWEHDGEATLVLGAGPAIAHLVPDAVERALREGRILLDGRWLLLERVALCRTATLESLVRERLLRQRAPLPVRLTFLTPTAFHSRGRTLPLPLPEVLFGGLLDRWHDWGGMPLGPAAAATIEQCAVIRRHRIRSVSVTMEGRFTAFVGEAEFTLARPDPAYAGLLALLAEFAEFAGVGQKVAMGMGCVRATVLPPARSAPRSAAAAGEDTQGPQAAEPGARG